MDIYLPWAEHSRVFAALWTCALTLENDNVGELKPVMDFLMDKYYHQIYLLTVELMLMANGTN